MHRSVGQVVLSGAVNEPVANTTETGRKGFTEAYECFLVFSLAPPFELSPNCVLFVCLFPCSGAL